MDTGPGDNASSLSAKSSSSALQWGMPETNNWKTNNGRHLESRSNQDGDPTKSHVSSSQDGSSSNMASFAGTSSTQGSASVPPSYPGYVHQASDAYGYGYTGYPGYYNGYQQQSNHQYSQPLGAYQHTGAPHQSVSSFQNQNASLGHASYSSTYYNPGDHQTSISYQRSVHPNQVNLSTGQYGNYNQYSTFVGDGNASTASMQYQQHYKQWAEYCTQTEVTCAPGTENLYVNSAPSASSTPCVPSGYSTSNAPSQQNFNTSWNTENVIPQFSGLQARARVVPSAMQQQLQAGLERSVGKGLRTAADYQQPVSMVKNGLEKVGSIQLSPRHPFPSQDIRISRLQLPTINPKMSSNLALSAQKTEKDKSNTPMKPAFIRVEAPKQIEMEKGGLSTHSVLQQHTAFPPSLRGYVERALARCKDETQMAACQIVMKDMITKATTEGTLHSRDWDTEPLFPVPSSDITAAENVLPCVKRSPGRRWKSRWGEPVSRPVLLPLPPLPPPPPPPPLSMAKAAAVMNSNGMNNFNRGWMASNQFHLHDGGTNATTSAVQSVLKRVHVEGSSVESPEEKTRRENRSKRFERRTEGGGAGETGNLYTKRADALALTSAKAVEDIDWDSLTVRGTCQEVEKRYLRLTSAPDPGNVRPEDVLEKALEMVGESRRNYHFKCDQLKSIRQDLTVQRIRNRLTVRVYEAHARLALQSGDVPEYNQCQSQLKALYGDGICGSHTEFSAYNLLRIIQHSNTNRDLLSAMIKLSPETKRDGAVKHALAVRAAVASGNYVKFFRLYKDAPNLNSCLMDLYVEKVRYGAVRCMVRAYRPTVPLSYVAEVLGFVGFESSVEWLKAHGASISSDMLFLDTKASLTTLFIPEQEDAVPHGDASLAVNDFFTRSS